MDDSGLKPYIIVSDCEAAIAFYRAAFGAEEIFRLTDRKTGQIGHAELRLHDTLLMLGEATPEFGTQSPLELGGSPVRLLLAVADVDAATARAAEAGAKVTRPPTDEFYGARAASVTDPFGHIWMLSRTIEEVTPEEMQRRWDALSG
ncbi:MAG: VOC family protein [Roseococcus sp.]|nr:VOC family protein [Roseococcus sp.]